MATFQTLVVLIATHFVVPSDCAALAKRYGYPKVLTQTQARQAVENLDANSAWPGVAKCRAAVRRDWHL